jgi:hypothetical protein
MDEQHNFTIMLSDALAGPLSVRGNDSRMSDRRGMEQTIEAGQWSVSFHLLGESSVGVGEDSIGGSNQPPIQAGIAQIGGCKVLRSKRRLRSDQRFHAQPPVNKGPPIHGQDDSIITGCVES